MLSSISYSPANNSDEYNELLRQNHEGLILSSEDFEKFLIEEKITLKPDVKDNFLKDLVFLNGGFTTANYAVLANELTFQQFNDLLYRFGFSLEFFSDHIDYRCVQDDHNMWVCKAEKGYICNSENCKWKP
ncbi:hypothetical protein [Paenibacillus sp. FSL E2-0190]|uniref:hypothetical protein n=1 Tax=Paenibacillus sp. FSL E2-0190 TaxID=2954504 RepID=UPI0030ED7071